MTCKLKILDPTLKFYLGEDEFDTYQDFKKSMLDTMSDRGSVPIGDKLKLVVETAQGIRIDDTLLTTNDSVVEMVISGLLDDNNPESQFAKFINTANLLLQKYEESPELISNDSKTKDRDFLQSAISFYQDYPLKDAFKETPLYATYKDIIKSLSTLLDKIKPSKAEDSAITDDASLYESRGYPAYIYGVNRLYKAGLGETLTNEDPLSIAKHQVALAIEEAMKNGRVFKMRLVKDNADNVQTVGEEIINSPGFRFGVVAEVYEIIKNNPVRVYVKSLPDNPNAPATLTIESDEAMALGANNKTGFTFTVPDFRSPQYESVNEAVKIQFGALREKVLKGETPTFYIQGMDAEIPIAAKVVEKKRVDSKNRYISAKSFLQGEKGTLVLNERTEGYFNAGNLHLAFKGGKVILNRSALNENWKKNVMALVQHTYGPEDNISAVVDSLNKLLEFKGSDVIFGKRGNKIIPSAKIKVTDKGIERIEAEEITEDALRPLLDIARINVSKDWLENPQGVFPMLVEGVIKQRQVNWTEFYLEHHNTPARQVTINGENHFFPIKSPLFYIGEGDINPNFVQQEEQPKIGDLEVKDLGAYKLLDVINEFPKFAESLSPDQKNLALLIYEISKIDHVRNAIEEYFVRITSYMDKSGELLATENWSDVTIAINYKILSDPILLGDVLLHEIVHALTSQFIRQNPNSSEVGALKELSSKLKDKEALKSVDPRLGYSPEELLGHLSNPAVVNIYKETQVEGKSFFDLLKDLVRSILSKVFNIKDFENDESLYTEVITRFVNIATKPYKGNQTSYEKPKEDDPFDIPETDGGLFSIGYEQESIDEFLREHDKKPTSLKQIVKTIDADLANLIHQHGWFNKFVTGDFSFSQAFITMRNFYRQKAQNLIEAGHKFTPEEKALYSVFNKKNFENFLSYWLENTNFVKARNPKEGEQDPNAKDIKTDVEEGDDYIDFVDVVEEDTNPKNEEKVENLKDETGGKDQDEGREFWEKTGMEISSLDGADKLARVFVQMLPKIERENGVARFYNESEVQTSGRPDLFIQIREGKYLKFATNEYGGIELNDYTQTWNLIALELADKLSLDEMLAHIDANESLVDKIPEIFVFRDRLRKAPETSFDVELYSKIEASFKRAKVNIRVLLNKNNTLSLVDETADVTQPARNFFNSGVIKALQGPLKKYYIPEEGLFKCYDFLIDHNIISKDGRIFTENLGRENPLLVELLGLEFHPKTLYRDGELKTVEYENFEKGLIEYLKEFQTINVNLADAIVNDVVLGRGKVVKGLSNRFKKLFELENFNRPLKVTTMVNNAEGELQSILSEFNSILQYRKHYNEAQTIEELNELIPRTKNDMFKFSITNSLLFPQDLVDENGNPISKRQNVQVRLELLNGYKKVVTGKASEGKITIDLPENEWIMMNFISMLKEGLIENTRAETATTSFAFRLSKWDLTNSSAYTPFLFSDINKIYERNNNRVNLHPDNKVTQVWINYLKGELTRIQRQQQEGVNKNPTFSLFAGILSDTLKTTLLNNVSSMGVDNVVNTNTTEIIKDLNTFFTAQLREYQKLFNENGVMNLIKDEVTLRQLSSGDKHDLDKLNQYQLFYVLNSLTLHTEETILFQGDLSNLPKYYKRAKGIQSTGKPLSTSDFINTWLNKEFLTYSFFGNSVGGRFRSATIADDIKPSYYYESGQFQDGYIRSKRAYNAARGIEQSEESLLKEAELLAPYKKTNIGDGDGFVNPDFYLSLLLKVGNVDQKLITAFKALALDARANARTYFGEGFNNETLSEEDTKLMEEGLDLIAKGKAIFPKLKVTYRGNSTDTQIIQNEFMDKFALFPLFPQFIFDKPVAMEMYKKMRDSDLAYVKFESGTKVNNTGVSDFIKSIESGNTEITLEDSAHELQTEYLREQIRTPNKVKAKNTFGTQFRKLIANIADEVKKNRWAKLNQQLSEEVKKEVFKELGIKEVDGKFDYSQVDKVKLTDMLLREAKRKDLPANLRSYLKKYRNGKASPNEMSELYKYFESSFGAQQLQSLLAGVIKKISIQKLTGAQLVQVSQSLFDRSITVNGKTRDLGFYHFKDGIVQAAEAKVAMQGDFRNLLKLPEINNMVEKGDFPESHLGRLRALNELLKQDSFIEKYKKMLTIVGYRIPTQGFNSMEVLVIREFLPDFHGNTIILPPEVTVQSGTDYDYDKLSVIFPSIKYDKNKGVVLNDKGSKGIQNQMIDAASDILLSEEVYHKLIVPNTDKLIFDLLKGTDKKKGILQKLETFVPEPKDTNIITFRTNLDKFKAVKGKGLLGIVAVWNTFNTLVLNHRLKVNPQFGLKIGSEFYPVEVNPILGSLDSSNPLTVGNIEKSEIISQLINVTVDMPSDDTFGQSAFNKDNFAAFVYSVVMLNYPLDKAMYLFHQPAVIRFNKAYNSILQKGHSKNKSRLFALQEVMQHQDFKIEYSKDGRPLVRMFEQNIQKPLSELEKGLDGSRLYSELIPVSEINDAGPISDFQRSVLAHYIKLLDQSKALRTAQSALNFDTSPDNNIVKALRRTANFKQAEQENIIDYNKIEEIRDDSVISGLYVTDVYQSLIYEILPILYGERNRLLFGQIAPDYGRNEEAAYQKLANGFLLSLFQNFGTYNGNNVFEFVKEQITEKSTLMSELEEVKSLVDEDYRLLDSLYLSVSKRRYPLIFNPQINLGLENATSDKDKITEEWTELLEHPDPKVRHFIEKIAVIGLVQSGWSKSPLYYSDLIPEEWVTPLIAPTLDTYNQMSLEEKKKFLYSFQKNFMFNEGESLGKDNKKRDYLEESYRLMDYTKVHEIPKVDELFEDDAEFTEHEEISSSGGMELFKKDGVSYKMNEGQLNAYTGIKAFLRQRMQERSSDAFTDQGITFESPLSKKYSGIIPITMWDNMVGLIGKGGVGKTTIIRKIINDFSKELRGNLTVQYVAPTHNAATVLQESLGVDSEKANFVVKTAASLVMRNQLPGSDSAEKGSPEDELLLLNDASYRQMLEKGFIDPIVNSDIIIFDEASMTSPQFIEDLMFRFKAEWDEVGYKMPIFIFMGDYRQLPPIEKTDQGFSEGIISATLFAEENSDKHFVLSEVMRSKDLVFHRIFDAVGDQITQQRKDFNEGKSIKPFDFKPYDEASSQSQGNLEVFNKKDIDKVIDNYTDVLIKNDNPYKLFWVHYNRIEHADTIALSNQIRNTYFKKLGQPVPTSNNIQEQDYVQYTGSLELSTREDVSKGITAGTIKPTARLKVVSKESVASPLRNSSPFLGRIFGDIMINTEKILFHNRQNKIRMLYFPEAGMLTTGVYNKSNKTIEVSIKDFEGTIHTRQVPYREYKENAADFRVFSKDINSVFVPSYIGSTHTVQGASLEGVIVGDYNIRKNAPHISVRNMESSLYTALTRTSEKLIIIKPDTVKIEESAPLTERIEPVTYTWSRYSENGYEVSSQGDKRFSALNAKLKDGRTIEEAYQLDVKGYRAEGNDWKLGKGKKPLRSISKEQSWQEYKDLWRQFLLENPDLYNDLKEKTRGKVLTDKFASTDVSQARALAELLNEGLSPETQTIKTLPMQPDNIAMIKSGRKTQTLRTDRIPDGQYKLPDGTIVYLQHLYGGSIKAKDLSDKDSFAYREGFVNWEDFKKNNKFSDSFINENTARHVYEIRLVNELQQGEQLDLFSQNITEAKDYTLERRNDPQSDEDWIAQYFETGHITPSSFEEHLDKSYKTERLNFIKKSGNPLDTIAEIISEDARREITPDQILEFLRDYKSVSDYWKRIQDSYRDDLNNQCSAI